MSTSYRTSLKRARGLGSAKSGTQHWWHQRLTSLALIPLILAVVFVVVSLTGATYADTVALLSRPWVAGLIGLALVATAWHMQLGMQVIIEDYIHGEGWKIAALLANSCFSIVIALLGVGAVLKLLFGT